MSSIVARPKQAGGAPAQRKLSQPEIVALRSIAKEPWRLPHQGFGFFWKFNRTWRRTWPEESRAGWAAVDSLRNLGLVEERYLCPTVSMQMQLQLSARGLNLLAKMNQPATQSPVNCVRPSPLPAPEPRRSWLCALQAMVRQLAGTLPKSHDPS